VEDFCHFNWQTGQMPFSTLKAVKTALAIIVFILSLKIQVTFTRGPTNAWMKLQIG
jgi:hypothetical protein